MVRRKQQLKHKVHQEFTQALSLKRIDNEDMLTTVVKFVQCIGGSCVVVFGLISGVQPFVFEIFNYKPEASLKSFGRLKVFFRSM